MKLTKNVTNLIVFRPQFTIVAFGGFALWRLQSREKWEEKVRPSVVKD